MRSAKSLALALLLTSCSLAPEYETPGPCGPVCWKQDCVSCGQPLPCCPEWWFIFDDPFLNDLEEIALEQNPTLEIAYQRIKQAENIADQSYASFFPFVSLHPFGINFDSLYSPSTFGVPIPDIRSHVQEYAVPLVATYELDIFGKIRNGYYADKATTEARIFAYETVKLTLTTDVALVYFRIRSLDAQNEILKDTIKSRLADVEITKARYDAGLANASDVTRAKNELAMAQADLSKGLFERVKDENMLATLLGNYASEYQMCSDPLTTLPPHVAPSLPSELLQRRPDIQEAERIMAAENARIGVARTEYFPTFALSGALGLASPSISQLFDWQSRLWLWAVEAAQVVFDAGRIEARNREAKAKFLEAVSHYTKTTLKAFEEAETALASENSSKEQFYFYQQAMTAAEATQSISQERYVKGLDNYLNVEDANRTLLSSQLLLERTRFTCYQSTINLVKALGGSYAQPTR